ncbi:MAG TPA: hypothetical protein V6D19_12965 [Stenomitos sp.]
MDPKNNPNLPRAYDSSPIMLPTDKVALATTYDTTISSATSVTLNAGTKLVEITALSQPVFVKWGSTTVTSSNFDYLMPANSTIHRVVPFGTTVIQVLEQAASATVAITEFA